MRKIITLMLLGVALFITTIVVAQNVRTSRAERLLEQGRIYPQGCSGFVCDVLGIPWQSARSIMEGNTPYVGVNGNYFNLQPGDIVGWNSHVAIYIGKPGMTFIDVREPGTRPRIVNSYGNQSLYKSIRY